MVVLSVAAGYWVFDSVMNVGTREMVGSDYTHLRKKGGMEGYGKYSLWPIDGQCIMRMMV